MNVNDCIKRAQRGDKTAFGRLRQLYRPETVYLAARFLLDEREAAGAARAVFAAVEEKLPRLKDPELFEKWLYWCVAVECRERLRERVPALFTDRKPGIDTDPAAGTVKKGERIPPKKRELLESLVAAVDELPVLQRFPFVYSRVLGYSLEETAAFLGLTPQTVTFRVRSAERALFEAAREIKGARRAGVEDIVLALRDYPARYLRPNEEELEALPPEEEEEDTEAAPENMYPPEEDTGESEEEAPEEEEKSGTPARSAVLPLLIGIGALLFAVLLFFLIWNLKESRAEREAARRVPVATGFVLSTATPAPGAVNVTAVPRAAITPKPTKTPAPTATPVPVTPTPDLSALGCQPESNEWLAEPYNAFVAAKDTVNVRVSPGTTSKNKVLGTLSAGKAVTVYAAREGWYLAEYEAGKLGWASGQYLIAPEMFRDGTNPNLDGITAPGEEITAAEIKTVGAYEGAKLYRDPSENATYTKTSEFGAKVCLLSFEGDWVFVNEGGKFGWMQREAFDTSETMDVSSGTYRYVIAKKAVFEDTGSAVSAEGTLYKQEYITPANVEKYLAGETVKTKKGTKLTPNYDYAEKSGEEAAEGVDREITVDGGELRFVYDTEQKLYAVYEGEQAKTYSYKKLVFVVRPDAKITDGRYPALLESDPPAYGSVGTDGNFTTDGRSLAEYAEYLGEEGVYTGMSGTVTVKNGVVTALTIDPEE